jgi:PKHD-type hydroxylase
LQLSHEDDYEGGFTQIRDVDNTMVTIPKQRGSLFFFDSRLQHRAKTVHKGMRKSLIAWAVGPRWK